MEYRNLGKTNIQVSAICLGTMTFGQQNTESESFEQLDYAIDQGINFIDTAEIYPVPVKQETYTLTETYIGNWLAQKKQRDKIILATKVAGTSTHLSWVREGKACLNKINIETALNDSLKRLKTDYIDLYQIHWPDRKTNFFGQLGYKPAQEDIFIPIEETLDILNNQIKQGKIRNIGLSNETPWGTMQYLASAKEKKQIAPVSIQNPYNLLNRTYEIGMAEISHRENIGLLAYSPLAFGLLTGKYLNKEKTINSRLSLFSSYFTRYLGEKSLEATIEYVNLAKSMNISPTQMALAYINSRPFVTSNIIGATSIEQLKENINSIHLKLSKDVLNQIEKIHLSIPNPAP